MASHPNLKPNSSDTISDTVETSDREADGRLQHSTQQSGPKADDHNEMAEPENGKHLDLEA